LVLNWPQRYRFFPIILQNTTYTLINHQEYEKELTFWRRRITPTYQSEKSKEKHKYPVRINNIWAEKSNKLEIIETTDAIK
jgi:hypothetical protein